jgi:hypothetical protein
LDDIIWPFHSIFSHSAIPGIPNFWFLNVIKDGISDLRKLANPHLDSIGPNQLEAFIIKVHYHPLVYSHPPAVSLSQAPSWVPCCALECQQINSF